MAAPREHRQWLDANVGFRADVLARLRAEGPLLASQIPDMRPGEPAARRVVGVEPSAAYARLPDAAGRGRDRRARGPSPRWDLAERVYPQDGHEYDDDQAARLLDERRLQAAGIARQKSPWTPVGEAGVPATIEGSARKWRVDPEAIEALHDDDGGRVAFLNPYDGMLFDRPRLQEIFEFTYVLEQFKPKPQRKYGFFAHPILLGDRFVGMLDAEVDREREVLRVNAVHEFLPFEQEEDEMVRAEIAELGEWLGLSVIEAR